MISHEIIQLQMDKILEWKSSGITLTYTDLPGLIEQNHSFNYQLWHAEDRARRDDMGFEYVYHAKREIDHCNQQRNNRMEAIDQALWEKLKPSTDSKCPVHSETPGMMIDRLSILALKSFHMQIQTTRTDVDNTHRQTCQHKLDVIIAQQNQLAICYDELINSINNGSRTFRVYHQFKMYNDPNLNPELYQSNKSAQTEKV